MASKNGNDGRVYGGDCELIHIADGKRESVGQWLASVLDEEMRTGAVDSDARTELQAFGDDDHQEQDLCPGCYMIVGYNMLIELARQNDQSMVELGRSMAAVFTALAEGRPFNHEEIEVILDPE